MYCINQFFQLLNSVYFSYVYLYRLYPTRLYFSPSQSVTLPLFFSLLKEIYFLQYSGVQLIRLFRGIHVLHLDSQTITNLNTHIYINITYAKYYTVYILYYI